jgi:hypothetical protein
VDFIEQWFHVAPDGGSGTLEAIYGVTALLVAGALVFGRRIARGLGASRAAKTASRQP